MRIISNFKLCPLRPLDLHLNKFKSTHPNDTPFQILQYFITFKDLLKFPLLGPVIAASPLP